MKIISLIFLTLFLGRSCDNEQKIDIQSAVVEYTANTRGFYQKIVVQNQTISVYRDRKETALPVTEKISEADWKELISMFQEIDLEGLQSLKAPSEKRYYDGAAIGNLKIDYKEKTYQTDGFDHGTPPLEIARFVTKITSLAKDE